MLLFYKVMLDMSPTETQRIKGVFLVTTDEETWEDIWKYDKNINLYSNKSHPV